MKLSGTRGKGRAALLWAALGQMFAAVLLPAQWVDVSPTVPDDVIFFAVEYFDANLGLAVGQNTTDGTGIIARTSDGGTVWQIQEEANAHLRAAGFFSANEIIVAGHDGPPGSKTLIWTSSDFGELWAYDEVTAVMGVNQLLVINSDLVYTVGYGEDFGLSGGVLKSEDGGLTWQVQLTQENIFFNSLSFVSAATGFVLGTDFDDSILLQTTDGGQSWTSRPFAATLNDLHFVSANLGFMIGDETLFSTRDGATWDEQAMHADAKRILFVDALHGYTVGRNGLTQQTEDGGQSWTTLNSGTDAELEHLSQRGSFLYASGRRGTVLRLPIEEVPAGPRLSLTPDVEVHDFGSTPPSEPREQQMTLRSAGTAELTINDIELESTTPGVYTIADAPVLPLALTPDAELSFNIRFSPATAGEDYTGLLTVRSDALNAPTATIRLEGQGRSASSLGNSISGDGMRAVLHSRSSPTAAGTMLLLELETLRPLDVDLTLVDLHGRRIRAMRKMSLLSGRHSIPLATNDLASGVYYVAATIGGRPLRIALLLAR